MRQRNPLTLTERSVSNRSPRANEPKADWPAVQTHPPINGIISWVYTHHLCTTCRFYSDTAQGMRPDPRYRAQGLASPFLDAGINKKAFDHFVRLRTDNTLLSGHEGWDTGHAILPRLFPICIHGRLVGTIGQYLLCIFA